MINGNIFSVNLLKLLESPTYVIHLRNGRYHREDGPAFILFEQSGLSRREEWWYDGEVHRDEGPAITCGAVEAWYSRGRLHREDGPAVIWSSGAEEFWVNGFPISELPMGRSM